MNLDRLAEDRSLALHRAVAERRRDRPGLVEDARRRWRAGSRIGPSPSLISKYVAGREKDHQFTRAAVRHGMVDRDTLLARLADTELDEARRSLVAGAIAADFRAASGS